MPIFRIKYRITGYGTALIEADDEVSAEEIFSKTRPQYLIPFKGSTEMTSVEVNDVDHYSCTLPYSMRSTVYGWAIEDVCGNIIGTRPRREEAERYIQELEEKGAP